MSLILQRISFTPDKFFLTNPSDSCFALVHVSCIWHSSLTVQHAPSQRRCWGSCVICFILCIETSIQMSLNVSRRTWRSFSSACKEKLFDSTERGGNWAYSFRVSIGIFVLRIKKKRKNSVAHVSVVSSSANVKCVSGGNSAINSLFIS